MQMTAKIGELMIDLVYGVFSVPNCLRALYFETRNKVGGITNVMRKPNNPTYFKTSIRDNARTNKQGEHNVTPINISKRPTY